MEQLGEYQVKRLIGEGGMGKVFEAQERLSKRRVALKVLRPELARAEEARRLFLNEMTILAHLDHPNVVRSLASTEIDGQLVMVLEYLEGKTLREVLFDSKGLPWVEAVRIAAQVASALSAAHCQEPAIVHRDLKPENIMILPDGSVKVMDFGIAKVLEAASAMTTHSAGTLQYMSPEQIDAGRVDGRSDLYCLGLVLYEMLAGAAPFQSASPRELLNMQCTAEPPALPSRVRAQLPKGIERLLGELLQKSPADRPSSAEDVLHELEPFAPADNATAAASSSNRGAAPSRVNVDDSKTQPSVPELAVDSRVAASSRRPRSASKAAVNDTIALVEAALPREVPLWTGVAIIFGLSLGAGIAAYLVHGHAQSSAALPAATASKVAEAARD
jgi:serine/threonine protein kinase